MSTEEEETTTTTPSEGVSSPPSADATTTSNASSDLSIGSPSNANQSATDSKQGGAEDKKVVVLFKAVGNAPILKKNKFKITAAERFQVLIDFLRKQLKMGAGESIFLYCNQAFTPNPDEIVGDLYDAFNVDGTLILSYCRTAAWG